MKRGWTWLLPVAAAAGAFTAPHLLSDMSVVAMPPSFAYAALRTRAPMNWLGAWLGGTVGNVCAGLSERDWLLIAGGCASALAAAAVWWYRRRDRKRAPKALGEKSRALVAALVARAREAARPRPVLRPQREGAS